MPLPADLPPTLGRYELLEALGQGGMGRVVLARDTVLGRHVAIKLLRSDLALAPEVREALVQRMRQEAWAVAALAHPNIVTLHDMGEDPAVGLYLVFEYVSGPSLRERLREGALPPSEVAHLARALGDALSYAHEAGVIHRDVKPENVLLSPHGPKMADFGLARLPDSTLTGTGGILGTPAYSAPETLAGSSFGPASDQFSLAATLYEALSGRRTFEGDDAVTVAGRVATQEPLPLVDISPLGSLLGHADVALRRGLAKRPEERFATARELGVTVATLLERAFSLASLADRTSMLDWARQQLGVPRRQRAHNALAFAALVLLVGLVVVGRRGPALSGVSLRAAASAFGAAAAPKPPASAAPAPKRSPRATPPTEATPAAGSSGSSAGSTSASTVGSAAGSSGEGSSGAASTEGPLPLLPAPAFGPTAPAAAPWPPPPSLLAPPAASSAGTSRSPGISPPARDEPVTPVPSGASSRGTAPMDEQAHAFDAPRP